jgi:hypothetical protein
MAVPVANGAVHVFGGTFLLFLGTVFFRVVP